MKSFKIVTNKELNDDCEEKAKKLKEFEKKVTMKKFCHNCKKVTPHKAKYGFMIITVCILLFPIGLLSLLIPPKRQCMDCGTYN